MNFFKVIYKYGTVFLLPAIAAAAGATNIVDIETIVYDMLNKLLILFWSASVVFFIWGVVKFVANSNDSAEHEKGKQFMIWGVIAFVVIVSLWGIVALLLNTGVITGGITPGYIDKNGNAV